MIEPILLVLAVVSLAVTWLTYVAVPMVLKKRRSLRPITPPISILKPLKGHDDALLENLISFAEQNYPEFEIIAGATDPDDPALEAARTLKRLYPNVKIVLGAPPLGRNPKVTNLASLAARAKYDLILISDSNVRAGKNYLQALAAEMSDPKVGLVTNLVVAAGEKTLAARFDNHHLNTWITAAISGARLYGQHACVLGKAMLFRKSDLEKIGGWRAIRHVLGEDYVLGAKFAEAGYDVALSPYLIETVNEDTPFERFINRHLRWSQIRRRIWLSAYFLELLLNPTPWLLGLLVTAEGSNATCAVAGLALKIAADSMLIARLRGRGIEAIDLLWIPIKDCLILVLWAIGLIKTGVSWRGTSLVIGPGSRLGRPTPAFKRRSIAKRAASG